MIIHFYNRSNSTFEKVKGEEIYPYSSMLPLSEVGLYVRYASTFQRLVY